MHCNRKNMFTKESFKTRTLKYDNIKLTYLLKKVEVIKRNFFLKNNKNC